MVTVRKPTEQEVAQMQSLPTWGCEVSEFKWAYNDRETCLLIKGRVTLMYDEDLDFNKNDIEDIVAKAKNKAEFGVGDLVTFEKGLQCVWLVTEDVEKYYKFG
jgi:hypothetical protein